MSAEVEKAEAKSRAMLTCIRHLRTLVSSETPMWSEKWVDAFNDAGRALDALDAFGE